MGHEALMQAVEIERNATDHLAAELTAAHNAGWSIRYLAALTGISKSRVDRLINRQLTLPGLSGDSQTPRPRRH